MTSSSTSPGTEEYVAGMLAVSASSFSPRYEWHQGAEDMTTRPAVYRKPGIPEEVSGYVVSH